MNIVFDNVSFNYPRSPKLLKNFSLNLSDCGEGKIVGLMGSSGCGKTTVLLLVAGALTPTSGEVRTPENAVCTLLAQEPVLLPQLSVAENMRLFERIRSQKKRFSPTALSQAAGHLEISNLLDGDARSVDTLSGGQRQRVALARALSIRPDIILLDEPCTGLDPQKKIRFLAHLREVIELSQILAIYVSHHADEVMIVGDEVVYLRRAGRERLVQAETLPVTDAVLRSPNIDLAWALGHLDQNSLEVTVKKSCIKLANDSVVLAQTDATTHHLHGVNGTLLFGARQVSAATTDGGFGVYKKAASPRYAILGIEGSEEQLIYLRSEDTGLPMRCRLVGEVVLFPENGGTPYTFDLS